MCVRTFIYPENSSASDALFLQRRPASRSYTPNYLKDPSHHPFSYTPASFIPVWVCFQAPKVFHLVVAVCWRVWQLSRTNSFHFSREEDGRWLPKKKPFCMAVVVVVILFFFFFSHFFVVFLPWDLWHRNIKRWGETNYYLWVLDHLQQKCWLLWKPHKRLECLLL